MNADCHADHSGSTLPQNELNRLREVPEGVEGPDLARIYADIRGQLRVPMVNLVYRHMASAPGMLEWAWASVHPIVADGTIARAADRISREAPEPPLSRIPIPALRSLHVDGQAQRMVEEILSAFNRANPRNLVILSVLLRLLHERRGERPPPLAIPPGPPAPPPLGRDTIDPSRMSPETLALVSSLPAQPGLIPSLYRHLANWPELLAAQAILLEFVRDLLPPSTEAVLVQADDAAVSLIEVPDRVPRYRAPDLPAGGVTMETLASFRPMICTMLVVGRVLQKALPAEP